MTQQHLNSMEAKYIHEISLFLMKIRHGLIQIARYLPKWKWMDSKHKRIRLIRPDNLDGPFSSYARHEHKEFRLRRTQS